MWENGEDANLLDGFCLLSPVRLAQYISFHSLPYAENGMHWSEGRREAAFFSIRMIFTYFERAVIDRRGGCDAQICFGGKV
jgi:hypothetical protein